MLWIVILFIWTIAGLVVYVDIDNNTFINSSDTKMFIITILGGPIIWMALLSFFIGTVIIYISDYIIDAINGYK